MASLRDSVKDYQEELRDGIAWVAFWKEGRSWNAELFHLEVDGTLEPFDRSRLEEIKAADPAAVILNGYYCGHLGENMSLDELTAGVRHHYKNGTNDVAGFIEAHDDRLPPELIEEAKAAAHAAGLPFSEKPYRDGEDFDPYVFDGSMSIEDYELMHRMIEKERSEQMDEWKTGYSSYDHDRLEAADKMKIERGIYFDTKGADISPLTALPLAELVKLREESAAAEQTVFENLKVQASAWEEQAGKTLLFDKAIEYARIPEVKHTANKWQDEDNDRHTISNRVYKMSYHVYENTRYDKAAQKSIPYSYTLSWNIYTNSPHGYGQAKIAGQDRKVFADRAAMEKYLNGRIKAYEKLFTEISPAIPPEYAEQFKVNGQLLPGYTVEGEEIKQPAADIPAAAPRTEPGQDTEQFAILIDSRTRFETGEPGGCWLSMPATKEELHEAMQSVGITADNPQEFFIHGYSDREDRHIALPYDMVCAAQVDELNFLAARLETLDASGITALNAATQRRNGFENIGQLIDFTYNEDFFVHIPEVHNLRELGDYYLNKSGMVQMPAEWKNSIDLIAFGRNAAAQEKGSFTEYGYLVESGDAWEQHFEGRDVPEDYRIMSYPQPTVELDAAPAVQATVPEATPQEPRPVIPIVLTSEKPAEKLKEITDRLEQGIAELFDSERYKEYLKVMSKFHNYSFRNTVLIAMQKPDASLVAGFSAWKNNFERNVMKGQKGIKIIAPSPYKIKQEMQKIDPHTQKPIIGKDGKPVTEEKEVTIPAYKVVSVFDVSQTEGKELPDIAVDELTGDVDRYKDFFAALEKTSPVPIAFENIEGGSHGYYHLEDKRIAINEGMSELQTLKTAIHEIAHAKLHDVDLNAPPEQQNRVDRHTCEVEAESVAYTVCQHFGLDTSDYSFGYVAGWSSGKEMTELKASLETIQTTAKELITEIEGHFTELQQQRQAEQEQGDTFSIYQLKRGDETRDLRFEPYDRLQAAGLTIDRVNYELVYTAPLTKDMTLGDIWERFNIDHPADFKGHSLSVSDIVVLHQNDEDTAHYVDSIGFQQVPEFLQEQQTPVFDKLPPEQQQALSDTVQDTLQMLVDADKRIYGDVTGKTLEAIAAQGYSYKDGQLEKQQPEATPDSLLTGETVRTPRGNFHITDMSREQIEAAGFGFHHASEDGKYLIMGNGTQAYAIAAEQPQRDNPLKHVEDTIEQNDNNFDGLINNTPQTPTVADFEQRAKAGEAISVTDLAKAVKAEKREQPQKKPSILKKLDEYKKQAAQQPKDKQKEHKKDLEV